MTNFELSLMKTVKGDKVWGGGGLVHKIQFDNPRPSYHTFQNVHPLFINPLIPSGNKNVTHT